MRTAFISDVHANPKALERVLDQINSWAEKIVCLGDVVGYGPDPAGAVKLCCEACDAVVMGNHDAVVCGLHSDASMSPHARECAARHREMLSKDDLDWLRNLPYVYEDNGIFAAHGVLSDPENFGYVGAIDEVGRELMALAKRDGRILFVGHTHAPACFEWDFKSPIRDLMEKDLDLEVKKDCAYLVNVGSVGYPRVKTASTYALFDSGRGRIFGSATDIDLYEYSEDMKRVGLPVPGWIEPILHRPVHVEPMYVCGNLHKILYELFERTPSGESVNVEGLLGPCFFNTPDEAIEWAMAHGRPVEE